MVKSSNLPNNINKDSIHFPTIGIYAKLAMGPTDPIPGPTFPKQVAAAPIAVTKSTPNKASAKDPKEKMVRYNITKASIKDALFAQKTFVWHRDMLIGKEENILPIMNENITVTSNGYYKKI